MDTENDPTMPRTIEQRQERWHEVTGYIDADTPRVTQAASEAQTEAWAVLYEQGGTPVEGDEARSYLAAVRDRAAELASSVDLLHEVVFEDSRRAREVLHERTDHDDDARVTRTVPEDVPEFYNSTLRISADSDGWIVSLFDGKRSWALRQATGVDLRECLLEATRVYGGSRRAWAVEMEANVIAEILAVTLAK